MKFKLLLFTVSLFTVFFLSSQNANALLGPCNVCTPAITDPCASYYDSGTGACYYGISCKWGSVHFAKAYCMSTSISGTDTSNPNRLYCFDGTSTYDGYANMDTSNPVTDAQCQTKVCGSSGWSVQNKADGTACTKNGQSGTCQSGVCTLPYIPTLRHENGEMQCSR